MIRKFLLTAALVVCAAPAFACECVTAADGQALLNDHTISIADVTVRGYNTRNGQSALQIGNVRHGMLTARDIRAKFSGVSCPVIPGASNITAAIKAEADGTYSVLGGCDTKAAIAALGGQ